MREYIDGQMLYVPKKTSKRGEWNSASGTKAYLQERNARICCEYRAGSGGKREGPAWHVGTAVLKWQSKPPFYSL